MSAAGDRETGKADMDWMRASESVQMRGDMPGPDEVVYRLQRGISVWTIFSKSQPSLRPYAASMSITAPTLRLSDLCDSHRGSVMINRSP